MTRRISTVWSVGVTLSLVAAVDAGGETAAPTCEWSNPTQGNSLYAVASGAGRLVAVGAFGTFLTSEDGVRWRSAAGPDGMQPQDIAWTGAEFLAVGWPRTEEGPGIAASGNGGAWEGLKRERYDRSLAAVACPGDAAPCVAVGVGAAVRLSKSEGRWRQEWFWVDPHLVDVAWSGREFIAVGGGHGTVVLESASGTEWTRAEIERKGSLSTVAAGAGVVVAAGADPGFLVRSERGVWRAVPGLESCAAVTELSWSGDLFLAACGNGGSFLVSRNGYQWTAVESGSPRALLGLARGGGQSVAVGEGGVVATSSDGMTWALRSAGQRPERDAVRAFAGARGATLALLHGGDVGGLLREGTDGWKTVPGSGAIGNMHDVLWDGWRFVGVGLWGEVATSVDAVTWQVHPSATEAQLLAVCFGGGRYVAVGERGTIVTSTDGARWEPAPWEAKVSPALQPATTAPTGPLWYLTDVAWSGDLYLAVGWEGTVLRSVDGQRWSHARIRPEEVAKHRVPGGTDPRTAAAYLRPLREPLSLRSIAWGNDRFVVLIGAHTVLTSPDGVSWSRGADLPETGADSTTGVAFDGRRFVVGLCGGALATSRDGEAWDKGPSRFEGYFNAIHWDGQTLYLGAAGGAIVTCSWAR